MAIWMGEHGALRMARAASQEVYAHIRRADVDPGERRFGLSDKTAGNLFITGDRVEIQRVKGDGEDIESNLMFVHPSGWPDNQRHDDGTWFVNVDVVGGVRLYHEWYEAIEGNKANAVRLSRDFTANLRIRLKVMQGDERCLARTVSWTLNTNRDVADITSLGEGFQKNFATKVSGSGELDCFFDVTANPCFGDGNTEEFSLYLHRLAMRLEIGSIFDGLFIIKQENCNPLFNYNDEVRRRELFYACQCVISQVGVEVMPGQTIHSKIQFVTTDEIKLLYNFPEGYLLQEPSLEEDKILQESDFGVLLEMPAD